MFLGWGGRYIFITTLLVALMGPFGAAMGVVTLTLYIVYLMVTDPVYSLIRELMPELKKSESQALHERIHGGLEGSEVSAEIIPLKEVMMFGTKKQKLAAIENILKYYRPEFVSALKLAVVDKSNSVRVLAATAIASLEEHFHKSFIERMNQYEKVPGDPDTVLSLAEHCAEYAKFDVFEAERLREIRETGIEKFLEYLEYRPDDALAKSKLSYLYADSGEYEKAEKILTDMIASGEEMDGEGYFKLMEIYFKRLDFPKIRDFASTHFTEIIKSTETDPTEKGNDILFSWGTSGAVKTLEEAHVGF